MMNEYMYNRFSYLEEKSDEELVQLMYEKENEIEEIEMELEEDGLKGTQKTDLRNDKAAARDELMAVRSFIALRGIDVSSYSSGSSRS